MSYSIVRFFSGDSPRQVVKRHLTLDEARKHCLNPETSSRTATCARARKISEAHPGEDWFDGFEEER